MRKCTDFPGFHHSPGDLSASLIALPEEEILQQSPQVGVIGPILKTQTAAVVQVRRLGAATEGRFSGEWIHL